MFVFHDIFTNTDDHSIQDDANSDENRNYYFRYDRSHTYCTIFFNKATIQRKTVSTMSTRFLPKCLNLKNHEVKFESIRQIEFGHIESTGRDHTILFQGRNL